MTTTALRFPTTRLPLALPRVARVAVFLFFWILPFHSLVVAILFGYYGISAGAARAIAAWKEAAVLFLLLWVILRSLAGLGARRPLITPDLMVGGLLVLAAVSLLLANPMFHANIPLGAQLYGFRDGFYFMLLYFVGRSMPELTRSGTLLKHSFFIALIISIIGILERIFVTPDALVVLGVASYMNDFLGLAAYTSNNPWGLPANYWTDMGGSLVRRSGSVFLHSQGFALPYLFLMPAATAWALVRRGPHPHLVRFAYALIWAGMLMSITRVTTVICVLQVALFYLMMRRPEWTLGTITTAIAAAALTILAVPGLMQFVWETLSWQTGSGTTHLRDWQGALIAFLEQPWGHGVGTTDAPPLRFLRIPLSADNMYLSYAVQLGALGFVVFFALLASLLISAWRAVWTTTGDAQRRLFAVVALTALGIFLNGVTSIVFSSNLLAYIFFLSAGAAMTAAHELRTASGNGE